MTRDPVEDRCQELRSLQSHVVVSLVDHQLLHDQLVHGYARNPLGDLLHPLVEVGGWNSLEHQAPLRSGTSVDRVAGEQHALGLLGPQPVHPHGGRGAAPHARRHVADASVLGHHDDVA